MNKAFVLIIAPVLISLTAYSQNLIMNPSFEEYYHCPTQGYNVEDCKHVFNPNCANTSSPFCIATPDYFNACAPFLSSIDVPNNFVGYQLAKEGDAYIGIGNVLGYDNDSLIGDYREYVQIKLAHSLATGHTYQFSFYVNLADAQYINITTNKLGVKFVNDSVIYNTTPLWQFMQADWVSNTYITDTVGWQLLSGSYTAHGGEKWMIIGVFYPYKEFPYKIIGSADTINGEISNYIYIEGGTVKEQPTTLKPLQIPNIFTPNGDGINDIWTVDGSVTKVKIFNRWGNVIYTAGSNFSGWNGNTESGQPCSAGVYYYVLTVTNQEKNTKTYNGFISLLK